jgi:hypothetical protein
MWKRHGELPRFAVEAAQQVQCRHMPGAQDQCFLQPARGGRNVTALEGSSRFGVQDVRLVPVLLRACLSFAKFQFPAAPLLLLRVRRQCSFPLVFSTMGVPRKPNCLRIWLIR